MLVRHLRLGLLLALVCASLVASSPGASGQATDPSRVNLQRENDQLRERVKQLEAKVASLERDNASLKVELDRLRAAAKTPAPAAPGTPGTVPTTTDVVPLEAQHAMASLDALLAALQADYAAAFPDPTLIEANKAAYIQDVRKWARTAERKFKGNLDWVIRVDKENLPSSPDDPIPFWVLEADSGKLLHPKTVKVVFSKAAAARILDNAATPVWNVKGTLAATPTANADRAEKGMLDFPPFIGPFAEFQYTLVLKNATPFEVQPAP